MPPGPVVRGVTERVEYVVADVSLARRADVRAAVGDAPFPREPRAAGRGVALAGAAWEPPREVGRADADDEARLGVDEVERRGVVVCRDLLCGMGVLCHFPYRCVAQTTQRLQ